jgi:hypothetical protein
MPWLRLRVLILLVTPTVLVAALGLRSDVSEVSAAGGSDRARAATVRFGVYPGGDVGATDGVARAAPVDAARRLELLRALRAGRSAFVLHEYAGFRDPGSLEGGSIHIERVLRDAAATGCQVEVVLRYQPSSRRAATAVPAYVRFVRQTVRRFGGRPELVGFQVTNEANVQNAPDAADGDFPGVRKALVRGAVAAAEERAALGRGDLQVGFNAAYGEGGRRFWRGLRRGGGRDFRRSIDYVGLDVYPGTWPSPSRRPPSSRAARRVVRRAIAGLRRDMRRAGLGRSVAVHVSEAGYPTGPRRSERAQARVLRATVAAVMAARRSHGVTDFRWFDLRDADSASRDFQSRYGLLRDDLTPKRAYGALRTLVARHGA